MATGYYYHKVICYAGNVHTIAEGQSMPPCAPGRCTIGVDYGYSFTYTTSNPSSLGPVEPGYLKEIKAEIMEENKLSLMETMFASEDDKALIKAGLLYKGELTQKGQSALDAIMLKANKAELVTLAKQLLEDKKN